MNAFRVLEIKKSVYESNDIEAQKVRDYLNQQRTFFMNVMSSPGSGKTTTLVRTIEALKDEYSIGVIEADIDSDVDAKTIANTGSKAIQLHTGGMCHVDALMTKEGLDGIDSQSLDVCILENIGNLICPAGYDVGAHINVMILSVPEGDDKPLKYPKMFSKVDALIINKIDALDFFDFSLDAVEKRVKALNPHINIFPISAKENIGIKEWVNYLKSHIKKINHN